MLFVTWRGVFVFFPDITGSSLVGILWASGVFGFVGTVRVLGVQGSFKAAEVSVGREERGRKGYRGILLVVRHTHTIQIPLFTQQAHTFEHCPFSPRTILSRTQPWTGPLPGSGGRHAVLFGTPKKLHLINIKTK